MDDGSLDIGTRFWSPREAMETSHLSKPNELLDTAGVAQLLGVSKQTLYNWRSSGRGPAAFRINGGLLRYWRSDVDGWLDDQMAIEMEKQW